MTVRQKRRARAFSLAFVVLVASAVACQQILGIDGTVTVQAPSDSVACDLPLAPGACQACLEQSCCPQARECAKDPACAGYESCTTRCGADYTCRAHCSADHLIGNVSNVPAIDTCAVKNCESACGIACGAFTSPAPPDAAAACQDCVSAHACSATETCGQDLDCEWVGRCVASCTTYDCQTTCIAARGDAASDEFFAAAYAGAATCYSACGVGGYWECVGRVAYPFAKASTITLTATFRDSSQHTGVAGLNVKACQNGDTACASPVTTGTTDANGSVVLVFPSIPANHYGFAGYLDVTSPQIVPYLFFFSFPLSEPQANINLPVLTPASLANLVSLVGGPLDPTRGQVAATASDCFLNPAPDVVFDADGIDAMTEKRYLDGAFLSNTATATDRSGFVFFLNAPVNAIRLRATPRTLGRVSSGTSVFVRPGTVSYTQASPTPP
jgi:hypothetical protein